MLIILDVGFTTMVTTQMRINARELYELFTLGEGNGYTEEDIIETAQGYFLANVERGEIGCEQVSF